MLGQRQRQCASIEIALDECSVFVGATVSDVGPNYSNNGQCTVVPTVGPIVILCINLYGVSCLSLVVWA